MATELTARLYFDAERPAPELLAALSEAVEAWRPPGGLEAAPREATRWQGLKVTGTRGREVLHDRRDALDRAALVAAAAPFSASSQKLSTRTHVPCWRFQGAAARAGSSLVWVEAWGDEHGRVLGEDPRRVWGSAAVTIADVGPFVAVADRAGTEVDENLDALTALVLDLAERLRPASLKVYSDQGAYLPFNAHLAYYRSEAALLDDLATIAAVWRDGLPGHRIPPLAGLEDAHTIALHGWRSAERRQQLWRDLRDRVGRAADVTPAHVQALLRSGRFDSYTRESGFALLEFPHLVNGFVDRFFLELLELSA